MTEVKLKLTELPNASPELPALYIYCDLSEKPSMVSKQGYMQHVYQKFCQKLPDHHIIVGDIDLKFAYITPQEAVYHELKQGHRSKQ